MIKNILHLSVPLGEDDSRAVLALMREQGAEVEALRREAANLRNRLREDGDRFTRWVDPEIDGPPRPDQTILAEFDADGQPRYAVCSLDEHGVLWHDTQTGSVGLHTEEDIVRYVELCDVLEEIER